MVESEYERGSKLPWRRAWDWLLLSGNRYLVASGVVAVVLAAAVALDPFGAVTERSVTPLFYAFSAILGGNLNLLTIVLSINQLVFSRELQPPGKYEQMESGIQAFRANVADATGAPEREALPVVPAAFAGELVSSARSRVDDLRRAADRAGGDVARAVRDATAALAADLDAAADCLDDPGSPTFAAVEATLEVGLADTTRRLARLQREHGDALGDAGRDALADVRTHVRLVAVSREYFKSLYTQEGLSKLSLVLLVVGVPAEIALALVLFEMVGLLQALPPDSLAPWQLYVALAVGFAPLAIVFSYVLRAATIAHRSASTTQFVGPPRQGRDE